jgi:hypothetical protein
MRQEPKHLYASDPKSGRKFVIKTRNPAFIGEIHEFDNEAASMVVEPSIKIGGKAEHQDRYYVFRLIRFFDDVEMTTQNDANHIARLMRRAAEWYVYAIVKKEK